MRILSAEHKAKIATALKGRVRTPEHAAHLSAAKLASRASTFWPKVDKSGDCWIWTGKVGPGGYGLARWGPDNVAHRVAYRLMVGPIPVGLTLDHLCRVRHCVNPAHLEPVTFAENVRRGAAPGGALYEPKTHCPKGHAYDEANTYRWRNSRACRACVKEAGHRAYLRRKELAA